MPADTFNWLRWLVFASAVLLPLDSPAHLDAQELQKTAVGRFTPQSWTHAILDASKDPSYLQTVHALLARPQLTFISPRLKATGLHIDDGGIVTLTNPSKQVFSTILRNADGGFITTTKAGEVVGTFLSFSDSNQAVVTKVGLDKTSNAPTTVTFTDLTTSTGVEFDYSTQAIYRLGDKSQMSPNDASGTGYWSCVVNNIASQFTPCNSAFLLAQVRACYLAAEATLTTASPIAALLAIPACGGVLLQLGQVLFCAGYDCGVSALAAGDFSLSATPPSQSIVQGQSTIYTITANFLGGFNSPIGGFSVSGLQSGAIPSFSAQSIATAADATQLTITTTSSTAPGDNVLTISATGGGNTHTITVELNINPSTSGTGGSVTFSGAIVSKVNPGNLGCSDPPASTSFLTTDNTVYLYFYATTTLSDQITADFLAPDGTVVSGGGWNPVAGNYCFTGSSLAISGLPASRLGAWSARIYDNGSRQLSVPFSVAGPPGSTPLPPPHINNITPTTVPVGINNTFTLTGTGFQQGFSGALWVGGASYPLNPGAQTIFISSAQVQLIVTVGSASTPTTSFGLQVINPDQQASAIYTGLTAQGGSPSGSATGSVQITFVPSSVARNTSDGKFDFTINLLETGGVGVTLTGMSAGGTDYSSNIASWLGSNHLSANGHLSVSMVTTCPSPCNLNYVWAFTGNDDNGHNGLSWSSSVYLGQ